MACFSRWPAGRFYSVVAVTWVAMLLRVLIPPGYMPAQSATLINLTFCHVGLSVPEQQALGLTLPADPASHASDNSHCLLSAQFQAGWLKAPASLMPGLAFAVWLFVSWARPWPARAYANRYPRLWARAPPQFNDFLF